MIVNEQNEKNFAKLPIIFGLITGYGGKKTPKEEEWLKEVGTYQFSNVEHTGHPVSFIYGDTKYKMKFNLEHGQTYRLPRHVVQHLESMGRSIYKHNTPTDVMRNGEPMSPNKLCHIVGKSPRFILRQMFDDARKSA